MKKPAVSPWLLALTLICITLRLTGYTAWPWWLVLSPAWVGVLLVILGELTDWEGR